jgi:hypothetical protein
MSKTAAQIFILASAGVGVFQVALALGAPWGEFTLGGRWKGKLPPRARIIPVLSVLILTFFCAVVLARAGFELPLLQQYSHFLAWVVVGYCVIGTVANAATPSKRERNLWLPVVLLMLASSLAVATS